MAKKQAEAKVIEVLEPDLPDVGLVQADGPVIQRFLGNLTPFFRTAGSLETTARDVLAKARALVVPGSKETDEDLQTFIKSTSQGKKAIEEHWEDATGPFHRVHRLLTAGRKRAVDYYDEANKIGNRLHNEYDAAERRRAAEEQERVRREAEAQAERDRQAELDRLEAEALKAESYSTALSAREDMFVTLVMGGMSEAVAATRAGYKGVGFTVAARLMATEKIVRAFALRREAAAIRQQAAAVKEQPLDVQVATVQPEVARASGTSRRTWHYGDVLDEQALIAAVLSGKHGIPIDVLMVNKSKVNDYAGQMHELISRWPGCRYRKESKVV